MTLDSPKFYFFYRHPFGQWNQSVMVDEGGVTYACAEQYMMAKKALLFRDEEAARRIMLETNPRLQQAIGREIRGFDQGLWDANKEGIVYAGNKLKFTQNHDLREMLLATHPRVLVEASPTDLVWGVGLSADDPLILDEKNWRGQNLLGKVLTKLRGDLRS